MCNEKNIKNEFYLNDNIRMEGTLAKFNLFVNNDLLLENCTNLAFLPGKFLVTKSYFYIYIFSTKIVQNGNKSTLEELAKFSISSPEIFAKFCFNDSLYLINSECQVALIELPKLS